VPGRIVARSGRWEVLQGSSVRCPCALPELAIDLALHPSDREELQLRFGLSGLGLLADLKLPFPDIRNSRYRNRELYALVGHHSLDLGAGCAASLPRLALLLPQKARLVRSTTETLEVQ